MSFTVSLCHRHVREIRIWINNHSHGFLWDTVLIHAPISTTVWLNQLHLLMLARWHFHFQSSGLFATKQLFSKMLFTGTHLVMNRCVRVLLECNWIQMHIYSLTLSDDIFKCLLLNGNIWISLRILLKCVKYVPTVRINNNLALVQIIIWGTPGHKPLSETTVVRFLTLLCITQLQGVDIDYISTFSVDWYGIFIHCLRDCFADTRRERLAHYRWSNPGW